MKQQELRDQILGLVAQYSKLSNKQNSFHPGITAVPPSGKVIGDRELRFLAESVLDGWFTAGRFNNQFEIKLASYLGLKKGNYNEFRIFCKPAGTDCFDITQAGQ